jgi:hypothetical protein
MFVFCFAVISMITPPVALATYAAATIAGSEIWRTGLSAFSIAFASFLIPYAFVYNNALLFMGSLGEIAWVTATTALGVCFLAAVYVGFLRTHLRRVERALLFAGALLLIHPGKLTDVMGLGVGLLVLLLVWRRGAAAKPAAGQMSGPRTASPPAADAMGEGRNGMDAERVFTQDEVREMVDRMARTLAMLYYHLGREVVDTFGAAGEEAVRRGILKYGDARGRRIREEVLARGLPLTVENLSKFYDLPLPLAWVSRKLCAEENHLEKQVTYCPFAEEWKRLHGETLGAIYCEQDLSMRKGYNPEFELSQFTNVLHGDPHCHTVVRWPQAGTGGADHV